jgi:photosystem II stability/assembly factor-like uncharacterized protein
VTATLPTVLVATWRNGLVALADNTSHKEFPGQAVRGLARDSHGNALAIVGGKSLCRRTVNGAWSTIARSELELGCCVVAGTTIYVGTDDEANVMRVCDDGSLERLGGFDRVPGRDRWYAGTALVDGRLLGPPLGIRSMAATCDRRALLVNVHVGGIPRSTDGGATWQPTIEVDSDVHQVCAHPAHPEIVIAATAIGLSISRDGGETWTTERDGLHAPYCSAVAFAGDDILVAASADHFAPQGAIYRRPIVREGKITPVGGGLPRWIDGIADTGNIAARGLAVVVADRAGNLFRSEDAGRTWSRHGDQLPTPSSLFVY